MYPVLECKRLVLISELTPGRKNEYHLLNRISLHQCLKIHLPLCIYAPTTTWKNFRTWATSQAIRNRSELHTKLTRSRRERKNRPPGHLQIQCGNRERGNPTDVEASFTTVQYEASLVSSGYGPLHGRIHLLPFLRVLFI
jgi:hypothetical protein